MTIVDEGTIHLVTPENDAAREWLAENTDGMWWGTGLAVEPRYTIDLLSACVPTAS